MDIEEKLQKGFKEYEKKHSQFINWLNEVKEKDDEYFEIIKEITPIFIDFSKKTNHPKTFFTLYSFLTHLSTVKNALIVLSEENNIYSMKVLYRVFLEHWLKGMYVWTRYIKEKTDDVGIDYLSLGRISEDIKYGNSLKQINKILDAEENKKDVWDVLCQFNPEIKKLDKKDFKEKIDKFNYKKIVKYLVDNKAPGDEWAPIIISEYSELSSFVHGGPRATDQYGSQTLYNKQFKEYKGMIRFSFNMCRAYAYSVFVLMLKDFNKEEKEKILPLLFELQKKQGMI